VTNRKSIPPPDQTRPDYIIIDRDILNVILAAVERMERKLDSVQIAPRPEWVTVREHAAMIGKSTKTVLRYIAAGEVQTKHIGGTRMVRVT